MKTEREKLRLEQEEWKKDYIRK